MGRIWFPEGLACGRSSTIKASTQQAGNMCNHQLQCYWHVPCMSMRPPGRTHPPLAPAELGNLTGSQFPEMHNTHHRTDSSACSRQTHDDGHDPTTCRTGAPKVFPQVSGKHCGQPARGLKLTTPINKCCASHHVACAKPCQLSQASGHATTARLQLMHAGGPSIHSSQQFTSA